MASGISGISGAGNLQDNVDYSVPHRPPPAPPSVASSASPNRSPEFVQQQFAHQHHQRQKSSGSGSILKGRPRKNSLGGLLRSASSRPPKQQQAAEAVAVSHPLAAPPLPPPPFIAPAPPPPIPSDDPNKHFHFGEAATVTSTAYSTPPNPPPNHSFDEPERERTSTSIFRSRSRSKSREGRPNMLRRGSKARQQQLAQQAELERREREAQLLPKQPPRLPSHNPLPGMPTFGGDDARPDSIAMFNQHAHSNRGPPPSNFSHPHAQTPAQKAANFSRPGNVTVDRDNSSSPAYALRGASASASPPPAAAATANGDDATERTGSMTNRGRYDYTSSAAQSGHVNSPRRMRRRKDPTAFK